VTANCQSCRNQPTCPGLFKQKQQQKPTDCERYAEGHNIKVCKTLTRVFRFGFNRRQYNGARDCSRAKIHFVDRKNHAFCNPRMKMQPEPYEHELTWLMYNGSFPCPVCTSCLKMIFGGNRNIDGGS